MLENLFEMPTRCESGRAVIYYSVGVYIVGISEKKLFQFFICHGVPKDMYCYNLQNCFSSDWTEKKFLHFLAHYDSETAIKKLCLSYVCLMLGCKTCHRPSGHSFGLLCMKFGLW